MTLTVKDLKVGDEFSVRLKVTDTDHYGFYTFFHYFKNEEVIEKIYPREPQIGDIVTYHDGCKHEIVYLSGEQAVTRYRPTGTLYLTRKDKLILDNIKDS